MPVGALTPGKVLFTGKGVQQARASAGTGRGVGRPLLRAAGRRAPSTQQAQPSGRRAPPPAVSEHTSSEKGRSVPQASPWKSAGLGLVVGP